MGSIRTSVIRRVAALVAPALLSGCFLVADLDRFHGPRDTGANSSIAPKSEGASDVIVSLGDRRGTGVAIDVVDGTNTLVSRAVVTDLAASEVVFSRVVPNEISLPYAIELFDLGGRFVGRLEIGQDARDGDRYRVDLGDLKSDPTGD